MKIKDIQYLKYTLDRNTLDYREGVDTAILMKNKGYVSTYKQVVKEWGSLVVIEELTLYEERKEYDDKVKS